MIAKLKLTKHEETSLALVPGVMADVRAAIERTGSLDAAAAEFVSVGFAKGHSHSHILHATALLVITREAYEMRKEGKL